MAPHTPNLKQIYYTVIPSQGTLERKYELLRNSLFIYWKNFWTDLFVKLGSNTKLDPEDFFRQDLITALMHENEVVGMHLLAGYTQQDLHSNAYFSHYRPEFIERLQERNVQRILALQYFMVDELWQKSLMGAKFAAIMAALSARQQTAGRYDVSVTLARRDLQVASLAKKLGCIDLAEGIQMHNVPVSLLACFQPLPHPDPRINLVVDELWHRRLQPSTTQLVRAA